MWFTKQRLSVREGCGGGVGRGWVCEGRGKKSWRECARMGKARKKDGVEEVEIRQG